MGIERHKPGFIQITASYRALRANPSMLVLQPLKTTLGQYHDGVRKRGAKYWAP